MTKKWMTIAELARRSGVGVETVRYYQRLGLLAVPAAPNTGTYRRYGADALAELRFVLKCKALGFSLKQIALLTPLRRARRGRCGKLHDRLVELRGDLDEKRRTLETQRATVMDLLDVCDGEKTLDECRAFALLEGS